MDFQAPRGACYRAVQLRGPVGSARNDSYCSLIPCSATTRPHLSYSARMNAASASGVPPMGTAPDLTILPRTSGSASAVLTASLSFLINAGGVFAGASKAYQLDASVLG